MCCCVLLCLAVAHSVFKYAENLFALALAQGFVACMLQSMSSLIALLWVLLAGLLSYGVAFALCEVLLRRRWRRNVIEPLSAVLAELRELREATSGAEAAFRREWDRYVAERRSSDAAETASDKAIQAALAQGERDIAAGRGHDLDDVLAELDATADGDATVTVSKQPTDARPCRCGATKRCPTFYDRPVGIPMSAAPADVKPHPRGFDLDEELASTVGGKPSESNPTDAALPEFRRLPLREGSPAFRELLRDWSARGGFFERMGPYQRPGRPVCMSIEYVKPAPPDGTLEIDSPDDEQPAYTLRLLPTGASYDDYVDRSTYRPCFGRAERRLVSWAEFDPNGLTAPPAQQAV